MTAARITPKRLDLLRHIGDVTQFHGYSPQRWAFGRQWTVRADVEWLLGAQLVERDPDSADMDVRGFRRTRLGEQVLAENPTSQSA